MAKVVDPTAAVREQFFTSVKQGQELALSGLGAWWSLVGKAVPTPQLDLLPLGDTLPKPSEVVETSFAFAEELLAIHKEFATKLVDTLAAST